MSASSANSSISTELKKILFHCDLKMPFNDERNASPSTSLALSIMKLLSFYLANPMVSSFSKTAIQLIELKIEELSKGKSKLASGFINPKIKDLACELSFIFIL